VSSGLLFEHWLLAFVVTQLVEVPIYLRALRGRPRRTAFGIAFGASAWTHPVVAFAIPALWSLVLPPLSYVPGRTALTWSFVTRAAAFFVFAEGFAIVAEAAWLRFFVVARPLRWSLSANLASSSLGAILTLATGWP
jgi:hypothetical protein